MDFNMNYKSDKSSFVQEFLESKESFQKFVKKEKGHGIFKENDKQERLEILFKGNYYDVTDFIEHHPGGDIIKYYTEKGEDATLAIGQFHHRSAKKVEIILKSFKRRPANLLQETTISTEFGDIETRKRHEALTQDFELLFEELQSEGFFNPSLVHVTLRLLECIALGIFAIFLIALKGDSWLYCALAILILSVLTARTGWLQHEGGHHSLTGSPPIDRFLQAGALGLGAGLSSSWFTKHHSRHHAMPQRFQRDSDLETLPILAFNRKSVEHGNKQLGNGFFIQNQAILFLGIDTFLIGLYWKLYLHPKYALKHGKYEQLVFMGLHYTYCYFIGIGPFLMAAWLGSIILIGNISLSHLHLPLTKGRLHWVEYALMHTTDVEPSWWCDYWMGYLNYQIEHHLFPSMPQYKNKLIRHRVKALADKYNIPYRTCSYYEAVCNCLKNLKNVSEELRDE